MLSAAEESKTGNSGQAVSDFGAFQFKSNMVIQSQDIKEKNSPIEEERSNSSESENQKMYEEDNEVIAKEHIGQINS